MCLRQEIVRCWRRRRHLAIRVHNTRHTRNGKLSAAVRIRELHTRCSRDCKEIYTSSEKPKPKVGGVSAGNAVRTRQPKKHRCACSFTAYTSACCER